MSEVREYHKCTKKSIPANFNVNKNDIVIVQDSNIPRPLWRLGIVENVIISKDNQVRGAKVRLSNSQILERPVNMLYPIEATKLTETSVYNPIYEENVDFEVLNYTSVKDKEKIKLDADQIDLYTEHSELDTEHIELDADNPSKKNERRTRRKAAEEAVLKMKYLT